MAGDVLDEIRRRAYIRGIVRAGVSREQRPVAADTRVDRDVLPAVRPTVGHGVADDAGAHLELREHFAVTGIRSDEPAVERAVENDIAARYQRAAPVGKRQFVFPDLDPARGIPGDEAAEKASR